MTEFHEYRCSESHTLLSMQMYFYLTFNIYRPTCVKFGITDLHITLLSTYEFRKNQRREGILWT